MGSENRPYQRRRTRQCHSPASTTFPSRSTAQGPVRVQSHDAHFGHAGGRLHEWLFATRWWQPAVAPQRRAFRSGSSTRRRRSIFHHRNVGFDLNG